MVTIKRIVRRMAEKMVRLLFVILLGGGAFIFLYILLMHRSTDISIFYNNSAILVSWWSWMAASCVALVLYLFGISAWLIPVILGYSALIVYGHFMIKDEKMRVGAFAILFFALSVWGSLGSGFYWHDQVLFGGLFGNALRWLVAGFDVLVVRVCVGFIIAISFVLVTRLAFVKPLVRLLRSGFIFVQRYHVVQKVGTIFVVGVRLIVRSLMHAVVWCCTFPQRLIQPALVCECEPDDVSIDAIVNDAFWHAYKSVGVQEVVQLEDAPRAEPVTKKYYVPIHDLFTAMHEDEKQVPDTSRDARILEEKLAHFGVHGHVRTVKSGPVVTCFEYEPAIDTKLSKITALADDLLLAMQALSLRIIAPIPGTNVVGFEVARAQRQTVSFAHLIHAVNSLADYNLPLLLGADVVGNPVVVDLVRLPHVLMAGSTGSGKSVALHSMILSLLIHKSPDELKLILIDPKRLELRTYDGIGHLLFPVVTDASQTLQVLNWVVQTMHERYEHMAQYDVRNIAQYHALVGSEERVQMPYIVIVIDELADLMLAAGNQLELLIVRIAQMARAAGIHLIVATQRPSVDVVTGLIKVNFVSRIALRVSSSIDSRVILDEDGAQRLVGAGDMLMRDSNGALKRIHGAYCTSEEITRVVTYIKQQCASTKIEPIILGKIDQSDAHDTLYIQVLEFLREIDEVSISLLQRRFRIGFNRSARIVDILEAEGRIININGGKTRKVVRSQ